MLNQYIFVLKWTLTSIGQELITALQLATICPESPVLDVHNLSHRLSKVVTKSIFSQFHIMLDQYAWITLVCRLKLILSSIEQECVHGTGFHFYCPFSFWSVRETLALKLHVLLKFNRSIEVIISLAIVRSLGFFFFLILSMIVVNCILNFVLGAYVLFIHSLNDHLPSLFVVRMAHSIQEFICLDAINHCLSRNANC